MIDPETLKGFGDILVICVPASVQFVLPRGVRVPEFLYRQAEEEGGLFPSDVLETLRSQGILDYVSISKTKKDISFQFINEIKLQFLNNALLGVGLSIKLQDNNFHFIAIKATPLTPIADEVEVFDTTRREPCFKASIDKILLQAASAAEFGRPNIYLLYHPKT